MTIPKILHFTWKTDDVPGRMGEYLAKWRDMHPDWDVRLWTDAMMRRFVAEHYPGFVAIYDGYGHPIQRADSFRYLVLNVLGGVYADLDVEPFRSINELVDGLECFVGVEPDEHMGTDRKHSGTPYLLSNAFMGAVPGHAYFSSIVALLPVVADTPDIFYSTGPSLTTGAGVRLPRADRPSLILPCLWSPLRDGGKPCKSDAYLDKLLGDDFDIVWADKEMFVSHYWLTSWVPWHKRHKWLAVPFHALHNVKWAVRAWRNPKLAATPIPDPIQSYNDQTLKLPETLPRVAICVALQGGEVLSAVLAEALGGLDYPKDRLRIVVGSLAQGDVQARVRSSVEALTGFGAVDVHFVAPPDENFKLLPESRGMARSAIVRNGLVEAVSNDAEWLLFVGGEVASIPSDALKLALATGYPVVAVAMVDGTGNEVDLSVHRYHWGGGIRVTYKIRGEDGVASASRGQRDYLGGQKAFRLVPLDGVGRGFVLARREVLDAGVCFAEVPYNLHLDGEGFALMARISGFEVAGMPEFMVMRRDEGVSE